MGGHSDITWRSLERLLAVIRRRLADFLELPAGSENPAAARIEGRLDDLRARLGAALAARRRLERDQSAADGEQMTRRAEFAIESGRDDLARAAVQHKLALGERSKIVMEDMRRLDAEAEALEAELAALDVTISAPGVAARLRELEAMIDAARVKTPAER
ncbi:MAG: hypothetical protein ACOZAA_06535 [Pseudomonadota bacterium]